MSQEAPWWKAAMFYKIYPEPIRTLAGTGSVLFMSAKPASTSLAAAQIEVQTGQVAQTKENVLPAGNSGCAVKLIE
jgi:hypothetical protein